MAAIYEKLSQHIHSYPEGTIFSVNSLRNYGSYSSVHRTLEKLCGENMIHKIYKGIYANFKYSKWTKQYILPSIKNILEFISKEYNFTYYIHGALALNILGLTTQNPIEYVYSTTGKNKIITILGYNIKFYHVPKWQLIYGERPEGIALIAIGYLGKQNCTIEKFLKIAQKLPKKSLAILLNTCNVPKWVNNIFSNYRGNYDIIF